MKQNVVGIFSFLLRSVFSLKLRTPLELFGDMERETALGFHSQGFLELYKRRESPPHQSFLVIWNLGLPRLCLKPGPYSSNAHGLVGCRNLDFIFFGLKENLWLNGYLSAIQVAQVYSLIATQFKYSLYMVQCNLNPTPYQPKISPSMRTRLG